jgi:hypothetical protein
VVSGRSECVVDKTTLVCSLRKSHLNNDQIRRENWICFFPLICFNFPYTRVLRQGSWYLISVLKRHDSYVVYPGRIFLNLFSIDDYLRAISRIVMYVSLVLYIDSLLDANFCLYMLCFDSWIWFTWEERRSKLSRCVGATVYTHTLHVWTVRMFSQGSEAGRAFASERRVVDDVDDVLGEFKICTHTHTHTSTRKQR